MTIRFEQVFALWEEGQRRMREAEPAERSAMERVVDALVLELRHRLGGAFTTGELAELYLRDGTDWCFDVAIRVAPSVPAAWDVSTVGGAAYARYVRGASDYGGGRRRAEEER